MKERYSATYLQAEHPLYKLYLELEEAEKAEKEGRNKLTRELAKEMEGRLFKFGQEKIDEAKERVSALCRSTHIQPLLNSMAPLLVFRCRPHPSCTKTSK